MSLEILGLGGMSSGRITGAGLASSTASTLLDGGRISASLAAAAAESRGHDATIEKQARVRFADTFFHLSKFEKKVDFAWPGAPVDATTYISVSLLWSSANQRALEPKSTLLCRVAVRRTRAYIHQVFKLLCIYCRGATTVFPSRDCNIALLGENKTFGVSAWYISDVVSRLEATTKTNKLT